MIQPSGRNNKLTLELQETKINALEELDKTLFERNFNTEVKYESKLEELQKNIEDVSDNFNISIHAGNDLEEN